METLQGILLLIPGFIIGLSLHEFAHALAADRLGDPTPRQQGRLTIEPWPHIDIFGFIMIFIPPHIGWAKPVQIDARNFKKPRRDDIIVSLAGPFTNLLMAVVFAFIIFILIKLNILQNIPDNAREYLMEILGTIISINILLFVFNLLPIPPLDGSHVVASLLPHEQANKYMSLQVFSIFIFIALIFTGAFKAIIIPPVQFIGSLILSMFGLT